MGDYTNMYERTELTEHQWEEFFQYSKIKRSLKRASGWIRYYHDYRYMWE